MGSGYMGCEGKVHLALQPLLVVHDSLLSC